MSTCDSDMRPLVALLAERVLVLFDQSLTMSPADIVKNYGDVVEAFHTLDRDDREQFLAFLFGCSWGARQHIKSLSIALNTQPPIQKWC